MKKKGFLARIRKALLKGYLERISKGLLIGDRLITDFEWTNIRMEKKYIYFTDGKKLLIYNQEERRFVLEKTYKSVIFRTYFIEVNDEKDNNISYNSKAKAIIERRIYKFYCYVNMHPTSADKRILIVNIKGLTGVISYEGGCEEILPIKYDKIKCIGPKNLLTQKKGKYGIYSWVDEKFIVPEEFSKITLLTNYILVEKDGNIGAYSFEGEILVPTENSYLELLVSKSIKNHEIFIFGVKGKHGNGLYINGKEILPPDSHGNEYYIEGGGIKILRVVGNNLNVGFYSYEGKEIVPVGAVKAECSLQEFSFTYVLDEMAYIYDYRKEAYGVWYNGKLIIPCLYDDVLLFGKKIFATSKDGKLEMFSLDGTKLESEEC